MKLRLRWTHSQRLLQDMEHKYHSTSWKLDDPPWFLFRKKIVTMSFDVEINFLNFNINTLLYIPK